MLIAKDLFDTIVDTKNIFVTIKTSFILHNYKNSVGKCQVMLRVSCNGTERIPLGLYVDPKLWLPKKEMLRENSAEEADLNLLINREKTKVNEIKIFYKLARKEPSLQGFVRDFKNDMSFGNFLKFFEYVLKERKSTINAATYTKENAILNKLKAFRSPILFTDIDERFFFDLRNHLAKLGNRKTTRNGNIKVIKKYLRFATKFGVRLSIDIDDIKSGSTSGDKTYLNQHEVERLYKYYFSDFISENKKLAIGYFLFSCFTGLRFSDLENQERSKLLRGYFYFKHVKTKKTQNMQLNKKAIAIIENCPELFTKHYTNNHTRNLVQDICKFLDIDKNVDYHTSRHTFGTNCILMGIPVVKLKILMNHSDLKETQVYVHLAELEKNAKADLLDNLF
jgi:site-specific recombinase XerD